MKIKRTISNPYDSDSRPLEIEIELTAAELEQAFRERERDYRIEDAYRHIEELEYDNTMFDDDDVDNIIDLYEKKKDCNIPENTTWESIIEEYISNKIPDQI